MKNDLVERLKDAASVRSPKCPLGDLLEEAAEALSTTPGREEIAEAITRADREFGSSIRLIRLVDGVSTYSIRTSHGGEDLEIDGDDYADAQAIVTKRREMHRADAILRLLRKEGADYPATESEKP